MNSAKRQVLFFASIFVLSLSAGVIPCTAQTNEATRNFEFKYVTRIPEPPAGAKTLRLWIPLPRSDDYQIIAGMKVDSPLPYVRHREAEYGDEFLYFQVPPPKTNTLAEIRVSFHVTRGEHRASLDNKELADDPPAAIPRNLERFLQPDRLVPLQGQIAELSAQETRGIEEPLAKARAIYNYVLATMRYDKSGTAWGNGDAIWACTAKQGNCMDFHSLLIGMLRAAGIPARFEIGFPLPDDRHEGAVSGYRCWAELYLKPYGWIPVDAFEASQHPEKKDYFFGAHDDNRVQFTTGRDILLDPVQEGQPLNYFILPYAELDGKPFTVESQFSFQDEVQPAGDVRAAATRHKGPRHF